MRRTTISLMVALSCAAVQAADRYVWSGGTSTNSYTNWTYAATNIQAAINVVKSNETVWVRADTYVLTNTVTITGKTNVTLKSESGKDVTFINGNGRVKCLSVSGGANVIVDGFTICNGSNGAQSSYAGAYVGSGAALINSTITGNTNYGLYGTAGGTLAAGGLVSNCLIAGNVDTNGGNGGLVVSGAGALGVDCVISNNASPTQQGGLLVGSGGIIDRCRIVNNRGGSVIYVADGGTVRNCLVAYNYSGGVRMYQQALPYALLQNCTIVSNVTGLVLVMGGQVENCVISHNSNNVTYNNTMSTCPPFMNNNCVDADLSVSVYGNIGTGNIRTNNPHYVNADGGDFRLASDSPCINVGGNAAWMTNATDFAGSNRIVAGIVDMGAYEFQYTNLGCAFTSPRSAFPGQDVNFTAYAAGTNTAITSYAWNFGDGSSVQSGATLSNVTYAYAAVGTYSPALTVLNSAAESNTCVANNYIKIGPSNAYVRQGASSISPYDSWANAATNIQYAVDAGVDGTVVWVTNGTYLLGATVSLTNGITLRSVNGRDTVMLDGKNSVAPCLYIGHSNAVATGLRVQKGNSAITGHTFQRRAGGVYLRAGVVADSTIVSNRVYGDSSLAGNPGSGGAWCYYGGLISNCTITANKSDGYGSAGVHIYGVGSLVDSVVSRNYATNQLTIGGGVRCTCGLVRNCLIEANEITHTNTSAYAPGIWVSAGSASYPVTIESCTVVRNKGPGTGDGLYMSGIASVKVRNCIFTDNTLTNVYTNTSNSAITYSCAPELTSGTGNITNVPGFRNPGSGQGTNAGTGDYRLQLGSPCINKGTNQSWMIGYPNLSDAAWPRIYPVNGMVDMGCYEFRPPVGTVFTIR